MLLLLPSVFVLPHKSQVGSHGCTDDNHSLGSTPCSNPPDQRETTRLVGTGYDGVNFVFAFQD